MAFVLAGASVGRVDAGLGDLDPATLIAAGITLGVSIAIAVVVNGTKMPPPSPTRRARPRVNASDLVVPALAGLAAGAINVVVGSGTLVTFPSLLDWGCRRGRQRHLHGRARVRLDQRLGGLSGRAGGRGRWCGPGARIVSRRNWGVAAGADRSARGVRGRRAAAHPGRHCGPAHPACTGGAGGPPSAARSTRPTPADGGPHHGW